jgi:hypothetical protein
VLARIDETDDVERPWKPDHRVRRFVRPVLMRDPLVEAEQMQQEDHPTAADMNVQPKVFKRVTRPRGIATTIPPHS